MVLPRPTVSTTAAANSPGDALGRSPFFGVNFVKNGADQERAIWTNSGQSDSLFHKGCLLRKCRACRLYWQLCEQAAAAFLETWSILLACKIRVGKQHGSVDKADRNLRLASSSIHERRKPDQVQGGH